MKHVLVTLLCVASTVTVSGAELRRLLVPTVATGEPGALGSIWKSELWIHGTASGGGVLRVPAICPAICSPPGVGAGESQKVPLFPQPGATGVIGYTEATPEQLTLSLRVQDLSRQALTWGTSVPVVPEEQFQSRMNLLPLPISDRFRSMLRLYAMDAAARTAVNVRAYTLSVSSGGVRVLADRVVDLIEPPPPVFTEVGELQYKPWYAQVDIETLFPEAIGLSEIGLEITPLVPELKTWAFVSVTNDETQHVTVILP